VKVLLLSALLTLAPVQAPQDTVNIEGRVLRAGSQDPIPNVQITLIKSSAGATVLTAETAAALDSLQQLVSSAPRGISRPIWTLSLHLANKHWGWRQVHLRWRRGRRLRSLTLRDISVSRITPLEHTAYVQLSTDTSAPYQRFCIHYRYKIRHC